MNENSSAHLQINQQGVASDGYFNQDTMNANNFSFLQGNPIFSQMTTYNSMDPRVLTNNLQQQLSAIENEMQQRQTTTQAKPKKIICQKNNTTHFGKDLPAHQEDKKTILAKNSTQFQSTVFGNFGHVTNCNQQAEDRNIMVIPHRNETRSIGVIGLAKSGKSFLIRALAGGLPVKELTNPVVTKNVALFELNHPNNGFISGSVEQNTPIYDAFFQKAHLSNLSYLIICSYGSVREEDYLLICLTQKYQIPCVIVRTKLDEWLANSDTDQSKEEYVFKDKQYVAGTLQNLNLNFQSKNIYNVSAIAVIKSVKEHANSHMAKYAQDEQALMDVLKLSSTNIKVPINPAELDIVHTQNGIFSTISNWISFSK